MDENMELLRDPGPSIQAAAERHLSACWEAFDAQEEADETDSEVEVANPAVGPFCGCRTCEVREVIAGAWPLIETYFALRVTTFHA